MKKPDNIELITKVKNNLYKQEYTSRGKIDGISIVDLKYFPSDDGNFFELGRLDSGIMDSFPGFKVAQINYSLMLPGSIKAWHIYFEQDDIWCVPPEDRLLVGLVDVRNNSPTKNIKMRFVMGGGKTQLLYIPRGVAHGVSNMGMHEARIIYIINNKFNIKNPDEQRLPWDYFGDEFWRYKYE